MIFVAFLLLQAAAVAAGPDNHEGVAWDVAKEATSLAKNIDSAIQACDLQIVSPTTEARAGQEGLEARGIKFQNEAPEIVKSVAGGKFGPARLHQWLDPHATIWLVASTQTSTCRVLVNGTYVQAALPELEQLIQAGNFYKLDKAQSITGPDYVRTIFRGSLPKQSTVNPTVTLTRPIKPDDPGFRFGLAILVAMIEKN